MPHGREEYEQILRELGDQLVALDEPGEDSLTRPLDNVLAAARRQGDGLPLWGIFALFALAMALVYVGFSWTLGEQADQVSLLLERIID